jgi:ferrous iron transport protein A
MGQSGRLLEPSSHTPELKRLQELGFVAGAMVKLIRKGPLGSPLLFEICQTQIAIRAEEAGLFKVQ